MFFTKQEPNFIPEYRHTVEYLVKWNFVGGNPWQTEMLKDRHAAYKLAAEHEDAVVVMVNVRTLVTSWVTEIKGV